MHAQVGGLFISSCDKDLIQVKLYARDKISVGGKKYTKEEKRRRKKGKQKKDGLFVE
jgi:hypothetical protein